VAKPPRLLSEVPFGAFLVYSPRGSSEVSRQSRIVRDRIKYDRPPGIAHAVERLTEEFQRTGLSEFLGPDVSLVPAPKSTPLVEGALWPARRVCEELARRKLGLEVLACVERLHPVKKSAYAAPGGRPKAQEHLESMSSVGLLAKPKRITVVDDVITKGATLLAAASHVATAFPGAEVRVLAMLRTMGLILEVERVLDPCVGTIRLTAWGETDREP